MLEATLSPPPAPLTMPRQSTILGNGAVGNGIWGLQWSCLLGKEHNHKLLVECTEPFPGWQACCRGQPERAIILWGGGNYSVLLMGFFLAVLRNGTVSQAWPWKGSHMAKRLCWSISHVSATPSAWNSPPFFFPRTPYFRSLPWAQFLPQFSSQYPEQPWIMVLERNHWRLGLASVIIPSQNCRKPEAAKHFWRLSSPTPLLGTESSRVGCPWHWSGFQYVLVCLHVWVEVYTIIIVFQDLSVL